jgi:RNA methyltransferase, TrmH family
MITSARNPRLKELRKLRSARERARCGLFAAEGEDLVDAALAAGRPLVRGYRAAPSELGGGAAAHFELGGGAAEAGFEEVDPEVLSSVSALGSGTRVIGVYEQRWGDPEGPLCVYLHGVGDPGNVGAVLRAALAFGGSCVALGPGCADPHSPKAVRASMGAIFAVPLARARGVGDLPGERVALVAGAGEPIWRVAGALGRGEARWTDGSLGTDEDLGTDGPLGTGGSLGTGEDLETGEDLGTGGSLGRGEVFAKGFAEGVPRARARGTQNKDTQPTHSPGGAPPTLTLLVGGEREGLPEEVIGACERVARIPIASESLNAAMAATVALYELTRPSIRVPES